jgi:hypothetical protein
MRSSSRTKTLYVTIVSNNAETLERLQAYFDEAGVPTHGTRAVRDLSMIAPATTAVVLFPDDFEGEDVSGLLANLRRLRPKLLVLVVTREPHKYEIELTADPRSVQPIVLPKPCFGWSILDAIRAHVSPLTT